MADKKKDDKDDAGLATTTAPAVGALAPEAQAEADERWNARVAQIKEKFAEAKFRTLASHWERGEFYNDVLQKSSHYGNRNAENFAKEFGESVATIYAEHKFYQIYTDAKLKELVTANTAWGTLYYTLSVEDEKKRSELIEQVNTGKITRKELEVKVKKLNQATTAKKKAKGQPVDNRKGNLNLGQIFRSTVGMGNDFEAKLEEFVTGYKEFKNLDEGKKKSELTGHIREAHKAFKKIHTKLSKLLGAKE